MASKTFALNVDPHVATVAGVDLLFQPEVMGDQFLDAFEALQASYRNLGGDMDDLSTVDGDALRKVTGSVRQFLAEMMLPESAKVFLQFEVHDARGKVLGSYGSRTEAENRATAKGATVVDVGMQLPDRILIELMEWVMEVHGRRPPTSSSASPATSPRPGNRGMGPSRSKGLNRAAGRSAGS
ncbi:hypothetical protein [Streptomyces sp. NBC_01207]|uniref:hypothetical protein n=1 Tax=Streptomyces sp. NBC_01207 TaxID=2903772 RepID=UPI002E11A1DC|nr:hypothetical protein OG457_27525 [Streptomyces sp. NBC_01207]